MAYQKNLELSQFVVATKTEEFDDGISNVPEIIDRK